MILNVQIKWKFLLIFMPLIKLLLQTFQVNFIKGVHSYKNIL